MKPPPPDTWPEWCASALPDLDAYVGLLATDGVEHGLIGPREVPRLWTRHVLNCAVVADPSTGLVPTGARVADVGSGAGLPGLVWALVRPDLSVTLIEPLLRRSTFLSEAVERLNVGQRVRVARGRAEEIARDPDFQPWSVVTARAVAPLARLLTWTAPLIAADGRLVALKGASAQAEVTEAGPLSGQLGLNVSVVSCGVGVVDPPTTVVVAARGPAQYRP